jgi:catechol 2,3-dioxygenase-like lactoylglutathione lyase family enzyme
VRLHHAAIVSDDFDASLRFWRDGVGLEVIMDLGFAGDWPTLFGSTGSHLQSVFLGDPAKPDAGVVELVDFGEVDHQQAVGAPDRRGFFLLSFNVDLDATLTRLASLGLGGEPRRIEVHDVAMAVVTDPNGVLVELIDLEEITGLPAPG